MATGRLSMRRRPGRIPLSSLRDAAALEFPARLLLKDPAVASEWHQHELIGDSVHGICTDMRARKAAGPVTPLAVRVASRTSARSIRSLSITQARQQLCPLLKKMDSLPGRKVGITVAGDVAAYLVSAKELAALEAKARQTSASTRASIRGSLEIVGDLKESVAGDLEQMALRSWSGEHG